MRNYAAVVNIFGKIVMFLAYMLHALKYFCKSNCPTPLKPGFIYLQSDAKYSRVLCVYFSMLADKGECVKTVSISVHAARRTNGESR